MTPNQQLAEMLLGEPVVPWIEARREQGMPWRHIARELFNRTNGRIDVAHETLRNWTATKDAA